jgi:hypothetical protein
MRRIVRRTLGTGLVLALAATAAVTAPGTAIASGRDDVMDLADTMRDLGYGEQAWQVEQMVVGMSDSDLKLLDDLGFGGINAKLEEYISLKKQVDALERVPIEPNQRAVLEDFDLSQFPQPVYPPQDAVCLNPEGEVSSAQLKVGLKATVFALREALTALDGIQRAAMPACNIIVIAIGIGGNAASACVVSAIALSVADGVLVIAEIFIENLIFCDEQVHFAESEAAEKRTEFIAHQLELHDLELGEQIATHDVEMQAKLNDAIARATSIEGKVDLSMKTQLELAMDRKASRRPSVFYEDRLDELCNLAQEAINDLPVVYELSSRAQTLVSNGIQFKVTDPKRAADQCIAGFNLATTGSSVLQ